MDVAPLNKVPVWLKILVLVIAVLSAVFGVASSLLDTKAKTETAVDNSALALDKIEAANELYLKLAKAVEKCTTDMTLANSETNGEIALIKKDVKSLKETDTKRDKTINAQTEALNAQMIATARLIENTNNLKEAVKRLEAK